MGIALSLIIAGLVTGIHVLLAGCEKGVDGRDNKPGHDGCGK
jgi:hypothetical protein